MLPATLFVSDGVGPEMIGIGEPRLRRHRDAGDGARSWNLPLRALAGRLRPTSARVPALGR
jgi:hypothetical protein